MGDTFPKLTFYKAIDCIYLNYRDYICYNNACLVTPFVQKRLLALLAEASPYLYDNVLR